MKVGIIGAGFGGLAAAYQLVKSGADVEVFEGEDAPGGLSTGFKEDGWEWSIEKHYHHWFTSDRVVRNFAKEVGQRVVFKRPKTSTFINNSVYQLDSPDSLLRFSGLSIIDRIRTGLVLGYLKASPFWKSLEIVSAEKFIKGYMGASSWEVLWKPLFEGKFSGYSSEIPASWFWARIKKRSASLGYPVGGYLLFAQRIAGLISECGGSFYYKTAVKGIKRRGRKIILSTSKGESDYDRVICTIHTQLFANLVQDLPKDYKNSLLNLEGIGSINLVLSLRHSLLTDGTYWLSINETNFPFIAVVEHTNFIEKRYYNNENLVYFGNYLPHDHNYYQKSANQLVEDFLPYILKMNKRFKKSWINKAYLFKGYYAQPVVSLNYSKIIPSIETPIKGLYLANMQLVYPWDRGTNYAVELGNRVADIVIKSK